MCINADILGKVATFTTFRKRGRKLVDNLVRRLVLGQVTAHGVQGLLANSFNVLELVFVQGLFEVPQASNLVFSTQDPNRLRPEAGNRR